MPEAENLMLSGNPRYQPKLLQPIIGYDHLMRAVGKVELATIATLGDIGVIPFEDIKLLTPEVVEQVLSITTSAVDEVERTVTKHDVRAWIRIAQGILPESLRRWVHVPLTSYDALDTARALQFSRAHGVIMPLIQQVVGLMATFVRRFASTLQIGRTHGQHALPITVGFWMATILGRIIPNANSMRSFARVLAGKISGAVGAKNALFGLGIEAKCGAISFEERVLDKLGLSPAGISTQILPPEPLAYYLFSASMLSATLGQLGRDCRNLMRTEIAEIREDFAPGQVGSSTMAHKRNPINFESLEGMWKRTKKEFFGVLDTFISEHQRDLVDSSPYRDFPIILVNLTVQLNTLLRKDKQGVPFFSRIAVDEVACERNFMRSKDLILAEPIYLALQMAGYPGDAHELVNRSAVPRVEHRSGSIVGALQSIAEDEEDLKAALTRIPREVLALFERPASYVGNAAEQALDVAAIAESFARGDSR